ncbi:hypothetical protein BB560_004794 [Smittium megazygosporum]|uniref:Rho-GAP domain-containing protein n=1 Tax=Smittium megazygosporum TaxID=133381 RepID=A0A2T9Z892_9FUNG|nr:hypothetical protein BB560_004794 [Smittium megazygosporum]
MKLKTSRTDSKSTLSQLLFSNPFNKTLISPQKTNGFNSVSSRLPSNPTKVSTLSETSSDVVDVPQASAQDSATNELSSISPNQQILPNQNPALPNIFSDKTANPSSLQHDRSSENNFLETKSDFSSGLDLNFAVSDNTQLSHQNLDIRLSTGNVSLNLDELLTMSPEKTSCNQPQLTEKPDSQVSSSLSPTKPSLTQSTPAVSANDLADSNSTQGEKGISIKREVRSLSLIHGSSQNILHSKPTPSLKSKSKDTASLRNLPNEDSPVLTQARVKSSTVQPSKFQAVYSKKKKFRSKTDVQCRTPRLSFSYTSHQKSSSKQYSVSSTLSSSTQSPLNDSPNSEINNSELSPTTSKTPSLNPPPSQDIIRSDMRSAKKAAFKEKIDRSRAVSEGSLQKKPNFEYPPESFDIDEAMKKITSKDVRKKIVLSNKKQQYSHISTGKLFAYKNSIPLNNSLPLRIKLSPSISAKQLFTDKCSAPTLSVTDSPNNSSSYQKSLSTIDILAPSHNRSSSMAKYTIQKHESFDRMQYKSPRSTSASQVKSKGSINDLLPNNPQKQLITIKDDSAIMLSTHIPNSNEKDAVFCEKQDLIKSSQQTQELNQIPKENTVINPPCTSLETSLLDEPKNQPPLSTASDSVTYDTTDPSKKTDFLQISIPDVGLLKPTTEPLEKSIDSSLQQVLTTPELIPTSTKLPSPPPYKEAVLKRESELNTWKSQHSDLEDWKYMVTLSPNASTNIYDYFLNSSNSEASSKDKSSFSKSSWSNSFFDKFNRKKANHSYHLNSPKDVSSLHTIEETSITSSQFTIKRLFSNNNKPLSASSASSKSGYQKQTKALSSPESANKLKKTRNVKSPNSGNSFQLQERGAELPSVQSVPSFSSSEKSLTNSESPKRIIERLSKFKHHSKKPIPTDNNEFSTTYSESITSADRSVFGIPLKQAVSISAITPNLPLPAIFIRCIEYLDKNGIDEIGLYRISGSTKSVSAVRSLFSCGYDVCLDNLPIEVHTVSTLFKAYLRELPEPLTTLALKPEFDYLNSIYYKIEKKSQACQNDTEPKPSENSNNNRSPEVRSSGPIKGKQISKFFNDDHSDSLKYSNFGDLSEFSASQDFKENKIQNMDQWRDTLNALVQRLPKENFFTLKWLFLHLARVAHNSFINKMNASNLGIIFCTTLSIGNHIFSEMLLNTESIFKDALVSDDNWGHSKKVEFTQSKQSIAEADIAAPEETVLPNSVYNAYTQQTGLDGKAFELDFEDGFHITGPNFETLKYKNRKGTNFSSDSQYSTVFESESEKIDFMSWISKGKDKWIRAIKSGTIDNLLENFSSTESGSSRDSSIVGKSGLVSKFSLENSDTTAKFCKAQATKISESNETGYNSEPASVENTNVSNSPAFEKNQAYSKVVNDDFFITKLSDTLRPVN